MKRILVVAVALALAAGLLAGCSGGGEESPFEGSWNVIEYGVRVEFAGDQYTIVGIGSGNYSYDGDYPDFEVRIEFEGDTLTGTVQFADRQHFQACYQGDCAHFVKL